MAESKLPNQQQQQQAFMRGHYTFSVPDEIINSIMEALSMFLGLASWVLLLHSYFRIPKISDTPEPDLWLPATIFKYFPHINSLYESYIQSCVHMSNLLQQQIIRFLVSEPPIDFVCCFKSYLYLLHTSITASEAHPHVLCLLIISLLPNIHLG